MPTPTAHTEIARSAGNLLAAWRAGDRGRLDTELERAAGICRLCREVPAADAERAELLEGLAEEARRSQGPAPAVWVRLLEHLARC